MATAKNTPQCGPQFIYETLTNAQMTSIQAIGAMANALAESGLNAEAKALDTNGYWSYGLWQFNTDTYPDAAGLVSGNCQYDIVAQVGYLQTHISGTALDGSTAEQVAGNFAANFENCQTCQPGGASYEERIANAATVAGWVASGDWPASSASGAAQASQSGGSSSSGTCLTGEIFGYCVLSKSEARAIIGGLCLIAGGLLAFTGVALLAAVMFRSTGAAGAALSAVEAIPGYGGAVRAAAGSASRQPSRSSSGQQRGAAARARADSGS